MKNPYNCPETEPDTTGGNYDAFLCTFHLAGDELIELRFHVPLDTKYVISETFPKPIFWLVWKN